ncbi:hypothetical protein ERJ75_001179700 [Trypanosoma vivax]|nr:hypothetical protein ERJ75_001179700 [Trypanosoma vivax]
MPLNQARFAIGQAQSRTEEVYNPVVGYHSPLHWSQQSLQRPKQVVQGDEICSTWSLEELLFSLKDHNTGEASCWDVKTRLQNILLLNEMGVRKIFDDWQWKRKMEEGVEDAPQFCDIVGEHKVLRSMMNQFMTEQHIWRDELSELMPLIFRKVFRICGDGEGSSLSAGSWTAAGALSGRAAGLAPFTSSDNISYDEAAAIHYHELLFPIMTRVPLLSTNINFYSYGLQDVLLDLFENDGVARGGPRELWHAFVASRRNAIPLPSPHLPPFSSYEAFPSITESEFEMKPSPQMLLEDKELAAHFENDSVLNWTDESKVMSARTRFFLNMAGNKRFDLVSARWKRYHRDRSYMNLVEPRAISSDKDGAENRSLGGSCTQAACKQKAGLPVDGDDAVTDLREGGQRFMNPTNGELEDPHLTILWDDFQQTKLENVIDSYRVVRGSFDSLRLEVFVDVVLRRALLLLFFARDEVRAITHPQITYRRLSRLHIELLKLVSWYALPAGKADHLVSPPPFEMLPTVSKLTFTFFAQLHALKGQCIEHVTLSSTSRDNPNARFEEEADGSSKGIKEVHSHSRSKRRADTTSGSVDDNKHGKVLNTSKSTSINVAVVPEADTAPKRRGRPRKSDRSGSAALTSSTAQWESRSDESVSESHGGSSSSSKSRGRQRRHSKPMDEEIIL